MTWTLRDYQQEAVDSFFKWSADNTGDPLLVLPTGSGKTIILSTIAARVMRAGFDVISFARTKELLEQVYETFRSAYPDLKDDVGIYSAGLNRRDIGHRFVVASAQSAAGSGALGGKAFGKRKLVIVDEAHQVPWDEESQYRTVLNNLRSIEPTCKMLGLTASPYRLDGGVIYGVKGETPFNDIAYRVPLRKLFDAGHIVEPITESNFSGIKIDTSRIKKTGSDFNLGALAEAFMAGDNSSRIVDQTIEASARLGTNSVLVFATTVAHGRQIEGDLRRKLPMWERVALITGQTPGAERAEAIDKFRSGDIKYLINVSCLTTGFDAPCVDHIVVARSTLSPGLFLQMVGRGFRLCDGKSACYVTDYGGNLELHGKLDDPMYGFNSLMVKGHPEAKICPNESCGHVNHHKKVKCEKCDSWLTYRECKNCGKMTPSAIRECQQCGVEEIRERKLSLGEASKLAITGAHKPKIWQVVEEEWFRNRGRKIEENGEEIKKPDTLRVEYTCVNDEDVRRKFKQYICVEHDISGYAYGKACEWWATRSHNAMPSSIQEALEIWHAGGVNYAESIEVRRVKGWDEVRMKEATDKPVPVSLDFDDDDIPF